MQSKKGSHDLLRLSRSVPQAWRQQQLLRLSIHGQPRKCRNFSGSLGPRNVFGENRLRRRQQHPLAAAMASSPDGKRAQWTVDGWRGGRRGRVHACVCGCEQHGSAHGRKPMGSCPAGTFRCAAPCVKLAIMLGLVSSR
jgi:hypothetical protein